MQFRCKNCYQVFSEELSFVKKGRTYSKRLAEKVLREALETDVINTAKITKAGGRGQEAVFVTGIYAPLLGRVAHGGNPQDRTRPLQKLLVP